MGIEFMQIQVKKNKKDTTGDAKGLAGNYASSFTDTTGQEWRINGYEIITVPFRVGTDWIAADTNLEKVGQRH